MSISKKKNVPIKFCEFLDLPIDTKLSGTDLTKKMLEKLSIKNVEEHDRRIFIVDEEVSRIFGLPIGLKSHPSKIGEKDAYRDKNGFNFTTLQKHISRIQKEFDDLQKE